MKGFWKICLSILLFCVAVFLVWRIYSSIMEPVNFNKEKAFRESVAISRLKDIRTLQVAFKGANNRFVSTLDSLQNFYLNGQTTVVMQIGSTDDSLAVAHTTAIKKKNPKIKAADLYQMYLAGDKNLVFAIESKVPVKDAVKDALTSSFNVDSIAFIPFSGGQQVEMEAVSRLVSGVQVPLFEARMPYKKLLKGMNNQLRINLDAERKDQNKYEGLQVGSVSQPNNNAGNWE
ncbi:MAG: hypothetical protein IJS62_04510 [Bacteroidales bacterium]|nr:hypothetical protein [Bacteroidales bacterium]